MNNKIRNYINDIDNIKITEYYPLCSNNNIDCKECKNKTYCCRIYKTIWYLELPCCLKITEEIQKKYNIIYEIQKSKNKYIFRFSQ